MSDKTPKTHPGAVLVSMSIDWAIAFGAVAVLLIASLLVSPLLLPFIGFLLVFAITSYIKSDKMYGRGASPLILIVGRIAVGWSSVIMLAINILFTPWLVGRVLHLELYNDEIPFITSLVTFPVLAVVCAVTLFRAGNMRHFVEARQRRGVFSSDTTLTTIYYRETRYQTQVLLILSLVISAAEYWYYFTRYINSNLNSPDRFFFIYMPVAVYILSVVFMFGRYGSMIPVFELLRGAMPENSTVLRYLVFCGDEILLRKNPVGKLDTPAETVLNRQGQLPEEEARLLFTEMTGMSDFGIKYMFTGSGFAAGPDIMLYSVFVRPEDKEKMISDFSDGGSWHNLYSLDAALKDGSAAPELANEIYRIYTITMAWKTYDRDGRRLYPIKHYRPTFRLRDLKDWTVDYDDLSWFGVAGNNEDRPFFRLRKLCNRLTTMFNSRINARG